MSWDMIGVGVAMFLTYNCMLRTFFLYASELVVYMG